MEILDAVFLVRKELRGLQLVKVFVNICAAEYISSQMTTYKALDPDTFNPQNSKCRQVLRRAIRFLQTQGSLLDWQVDEICPESLPVEADTPI